MYHRSCKVSCAGRSRAADCRTSFHCARLGVERLFKDHVVIVKNAIRICHCGIVVVIFWFTPKYLPGFQIKGYQDAVNFTSIEYSIDRLWWVNLAGRSRGPGGLSGLSGSFLAGYKQKNNRAKTYKEQAHVGGVMGGG
jgi:hypothetical protein